LEYFIGFVVLLGVLIFVHEFGHFIVAKLVDIKVLKFSLGFPPSLLKRKWGETEYILGAVPLGGYVKLLGEDIDTEDQIPPEEIHRAYTSKPVSSRLAVILAGPIANYLLAMILLCLGYAMGWPVLAADVGKVLENSPAMEAGLKPGDQVVAIDGKPVNRWDDMRAIIEQSAGKRLILTMDRGGKEIDVNVTPVVGDQKDVFGKPIGRIGVMPSGKKITLSLAASIFEGIRFTGHLTGLVIETLVKLVRMEISPKALSGPITIAQASGESLGAGFFSFIFLLSFISINLAIINLLPVPVLDGGHVMFLIIEGVTRRPLTGKVREIATHAGLLFIIFLMALVFYNDISRIVEHGWSLKP